LVDQEQCDLCLQKGKLLGHCEKQTRRRSRSRMRLELERREENRKTKRMQKLTKTEKEAVEGLRDIFEQLFDYLKHSPEVER
jgi:hypothetical protein